MDKKYTSLENAIRNVVRGNTGAAQDNRSLESKIRSVVLTESMVGYTAASERTENGHRAIVKDSKGQTRYAGGSEYPTKRHAINGANIYIRNGGGEDGADMERDYNKQVMFQTHVEEVGLEEARKKSAASLGFISTNAGHGITASSEPYGYSHLPVVTTSSGKRVDVGHKPYPTPELAQQGAEEFIKNTYTRQGTDPVRGFKALSKHHNENAKKKTNEDVSINEAPDDAAPPGENHLSVHELFGHLREYNEDHDRSTDPDDPDEEGAKESRSNINSTEKMIKKIHGQDTLDHVRNAIEAERHIRLRTNPGVNNHQAVKAHLEAAVRASRHFSEAHKERYIITPSGRSSLNEGSAKFAKIMARTAAARGEPITTDTTELEKKHNELLQNSRDAADKAKQARTDYENLAKKYGITPEPIGEEVDFEEALGTGGNEGGEFKGTPPAFFKSVHIEPKVGDAHPPAQGSTAAARNRAKIATSETMKKESYIITPRGRASIGEGILTGAAELGLDLLKAGGKKAGTLVKDAEQWAPPGWVASAEKAATGTEVALPGATKGTNLVTKAPGITAADDIAAEAPVISKGTDVTIPGQQTMPKVTSQVPATITEPTLKAATTAAEPVIAPVTKAANKVATTAAEPVTKVSNKIAPAIKVAGKVLKGAGIAAGAAAAGMAASELLGGGGGGIASSSETPSPAGNRIDLSKHRHFAKNRIVYGQEIHYNEYEPAGDYIGEDSAEQTDAERSAIENVARPNSKNKLTKQAELRNKIIEDTQRRKSVILRAKEENKNGKDGANPDIETKPELKHVKEEDNWYDTAKGYIKSPDALIGAGTYGAVKGAGAFLGKKLPGVGAAINAADAYGRIKRGDYTGAAINGASGVASFFPGIGTAIATGLDAANLARDYAKENPTQPSFDNTGNSPTTTKPANGIQRALGVRSGFMPSPSSSPTNKETVPAPTSTTNIGSVGGAVAGKAITQSSKLGSVGGAVAGKAITKVAPKPALKLPGPGTPGYRTDAQMNDYEAKRAEMLNKYPNSVGAQSAGNRSVEAATKSLNTNTPAVEPQQSQGINSTNTPASPTMGSSWNNSYKNKYSMGPGPSQFPSK